MIDERIFDWRRMVEPDGQECPDCVESADESMDRPKVERILDRNERIKLMLYMGCPDIIVKNERRLLWQEEVAAGRRVVS